MSGVVDSALTYQEGPMSRLACEPGDVGETILRAIEDDRPRARYRVAASAPIMLTTRKLLPDAAFDAFIRTQFPSPEPSSKG